MTLPKWFRPRGSGEARPPVSPLVVILLPDKFTSVLATEKDFQLRRPQEAKSHYDVPAVETVFTTLRGGRIERRTWAIRQPVQMAIFEESNIRHSTVPISRRSILKLPI
jgi:hypothetical protein